MIELKPIGIIYGRFKDLSGTPIPPSGAAGVTGTVEVFNDIDGRTSRRHACPT
jgi:hypothetical protein